MRILSGIQPSGETHLGNFFGAMRQHVALQTEGDAIYFVAGSAIMSSSITTAPELRAGVPRVILDDPLVGRFGAGNMPLAVAPDGRILAIREDDSVKPDHVVVLQNWRASTNAPR